MLFRSVDALHEAAAELGAADVQHTVALGHVIDLAVLVELLDEAEHLVHEHRDADLVLVLGDQLLCAIGVVEGLAVPVVAGAGVVAAHDEVGQP